MKLDKKMVLIISAAVLLIIVAIAAISLSLRNNSTGSVINDKDTGESIDLSTEAQASTGANNEVTSTVVLFGLADTITAVRNGGDTNTGSFITSVREGLWGYSRERLDDAFSTITILPHTLVVKENTITAELRLGQQSSTVVPIKIEMTKNRASAIVTIDEASTVQQYNGKYVYVGGLKSNSPLFKMAQKDTASSTIIVTAVHGNRESALNHLVKVGYSISELTIEFANYERPQL